jgi:hypothetical protein
MCVSSFSANFIRNIFHFMKKWARYDRKCILVFVWSTRYFRPIYWILIFSTDFRKILKFQILWKSVPWEPSCSILTVGRTDMTKLTVAFHNFAKAPKMTIQNVCHKKLCSLTKFKFCMKLKIQIGRQKTNLQIWCWMQLMQTIFMASDIQEYCTLP